MSSIGFSGDNYAGNYASYSDLVVGEPVGLQSAGRLATVSTQGSTVTHYLCDGTSWNPILPGLLNASGNLIGLRGFDSEFAQIPAVLKIDANLVRTAVGSAADATDVTMAQFTLPGGFMGNNGQLMVVAQIAKTITTQNSNLSFWVGGQTLSSPPVLAANARAGTMMLASMKGSSTVMEGVNLGLNPFNQGTGAIISRNIDTTVDQEVLITLNWSAAVTAGDICRIMSLLVLGFPGT